VKLVQVPKIKAAEYIPVRPWRCETDFCSNAR